MNDEHGFHVRPLVLHSIIVHAQKYNHLIFQHLNLFLAHTYSLGLRCTQILKKKKRNEHNYGIVHKKVTKSYYGIFNLIAEVDLTEWIEFNDVSQ